MTRRPGRVDVALALAAVLPSWAALAAHLEPEARPADLGAVLLLALLGAPVLVLRHRPVVALAATLAVLYLYYVLGYSAVGLVVPLAPAFYTLAEAGRWRTGAAAGVVLTALTTTWRLVEPSPDENPGLVLGYDLALSTVLLAAVLAFGDAVHSRRRWRAETAERLRRAAEERDAEAARRVAEERMRIARDVHDSLGHAVAVVTLHAAVAAEALDDDPAAARRALGTIRTVSRDVLHDLRGTVGLLRGRDPEDGAGSAGLADLPRLVAATAATGLDVRLAVEGEPGPLPAGVEATVHRVVQEALTNVLRHARAATATVTVTHDPGALTVSVVDDGRGACVPGAAGHGLAGMRERVGLLGGRLSAGQRHGGGFAVRAVLPVADRVRTPA
ncbi:sensor histidine kinase [Geodermatophilus sp. SYSU D00758]